MSSVEYCVRCNCTAEITICNFCIPWFSIYTELKGQINAFLKRAFKYVFCTSVHTIDVIAQEADRSLFAKMAGSQHCLHTLFPDIKPYSCRLRPKGHAYKLPECSRDLYKKSFIPRCLFRYS